MNTIPTPETDAQKTMLTDCGTQVVDADFSRSLERRLHVAVEALKAIGDARERSRRTATMISEQALSQIASMKERHE